MILTYRLKSKETSLHEEMFILLIVTPAFECFKELRYFRNFSKLHF